MFNEGANKFKDKNDASKKFVLSQKNLIAIYTVLSILKKMKDRLGLEAMLEYMEKYRAVIERPNPKIKNAVHYALTLVDVERIYDEIGKKSEDS